MQEPFAASAPPERLMTPVPAVAVIDPVHVVLKPLGVDTINPAGRVSLNEIPVAANAFGLVTVKPTFVVPFSGIVAEPNVFVIVGGGGFTTIVAVEKGQMVHTRLLANTCAVFKYVPALEPGGGVVGLCTWTVA
jgi:hypothetical protein